mmetsp:Transcript_20193/g.47085  ORF Transcript_20193/g.47085 Transcript_20193/m.47085 type:complete len:897 (+) Transcript_20193:73-2763(+)
MSEEETRVDDTCTGGATERDRVPAPVDSGEAGMSDKQLSTASQSTAYHVLVPEGVQPGGVVRFTDIDGVIWAAFVPHGFSSGQVFEVHMYNGEVYQPQIVLIPEGMGPGQILQFPGINGQTMAAAVPEGGEPGQSFPVWHRLQRWTEDSTNDLMWMPMEVGIPEGAIAGQVVMFNAPDGKRYSAHVPKVTDPGACTKFLVYLHGGRAWQAYPVQVPAGANPGDAVSFPGLDGRTTHSAVVPPGIAEGASFMAWSWTLPVPEPAPVEELSEDELQPWLAAAKDFELNEDFAVPPLEDASQQIGYLDLLEQMKKCSEGKPTIQALGDKILLSDLVASMGIPEMPLLLDIREEAEVQDKVESFVEECSTSTERPPCAVFIKPSHLSSGQGVLQLPQPNPLQEQKAFQPTTEEEKKTTVARVSEHIKKYLQERAAATESLALQSLRPGFLAQPRYDSAIKFDWPLEMRVVVLWGKARLGVWWWCRDEGLAGTTPQRNAWFVRRPTTPGQLSDDDGWEVAHEHPHGNEGFEAAIEIFQLHMSAMALAAEALTTAIGAPCLRVDFFVGSPRWGVRLNEVAYGSTVEHRRFPKGANKLDECQGARLLDDSPAIAQILQQGMKQCKRALPRKYFLQRLGVEGDTYAEMHVETPPAASLATIGNPQALQYLQDLAANGDAVSAGYEKRAVACSTPRAGGLPSPCWQGGDCYVQPAVGGKFSMPPSGTEKALHTVQKEKPWQPIEGQFVNDLAVSVQLLCEHAKKQTLVATLLPGEQKVVQVPCGATIVAADNFGLEVVRWTPPLDGVDDEGSNSREALKPTVIHVQREDVQASFDNRTWIKIVVEWKHPRTGERHPCLNLEVGEAATLQTFHGHEFVVLNANGSILQTVHVDESQGLKQRYVFGD